MAAYVVAEIDVLDKDKFETYKQMASPTIASYGGRYLVRGGAVETLEGNWSPKRFVILEFPSVERAKAWWNSPDYVKCREVREAAAHSKFLVVEGL